MAASLRKGLAAVALLAMLAVALGQPCIECKDCKTNNCYSRCQKQCPATVQGDRCIKFGKDKGAQIGKDACSTTQTYCKGSKSVGVGSARRGFQVTLTQCENIAYGACQQKAKEVATSIWSSCRWSFNGYQQCNKQQFNDFFNGEVNELCERAVSVIDP